MRATANNADEATSALEARKRERASFVEEKERAELAAAAAAAAAEGRHEQSQGARRSGSLRCRARTAPAGLQLQRRPAAAAAADIGPRSREVSAWRRLRVGRPNTVPPARCSSGVTTQTSIKIWIRRHCRIVKRMGGRETPG